MNPKDCISCLHVPIHLPEISWKANSLYCGSQYEPWIEALYPPVEHKPKEGGWWDCHDVKRNQIHFQAYNLPSQALQSNTTLKVTKSFELKMEVLSWERT